MEESIRRVMDAYRNMPREPAPSDTPAAIEYQPDPPALEYRPSPSHLPMPEFSKDFERPRHESLEREIEEKMREQYLPIKMESERKKRFGLDEKREYDEAFESVGVDLAKKKLPTKKKKKKKLDK